MAVSMYHRSLQLLVENQYKRTRTAAATSVSSAIGDFSPILPNRIQFLGSTLDLRQSSQRVVSARRKVLSRGEVVASASHRRNQLNSKTEESRFVPSLGGGQRRKIVLDDSVLVNAADLRSAETVPPETWVKRVFPETLYPYAQLARIENPIGTWLFAWPTFWSLCLAAPSGSVPDLQLSALFAVWCLVQRGFAATINDIFDADIDKYVERSKSRPLPAGTVTIPQSVVFLGLQFLVAVALLLPLNPTSQYLGIAFAPLAAIYPLLKRVTYWPQAYLGLIASWGIPVAWAAVYGSLDYPSILPLLASGFFWILVIDTIYTHQDKTDDVKVGAKSTALLFKENSRSIIAAFGACSIGLLTWTGYHAGLGWGFYAGAVASTAHLAWQILDVDLDNPKDCGAKHKSNSVYGAIVCAAILLGKLTA